MVVPTYRSTEHLDALVASLDAQTLPQGELEVLLIDDGSPDDTLSRLRAFAGARDNYRVIGLPPSGWPSRPRNVGIEEAAGTYVVFVDHDDRLFPDALRAACALADRTGADVLDGKESKSDTPCWAMRDLDRDVENAIDWIEPHPLLPMNPHKMFRTAFLRESGIRFPEGGRQIWEDIAFDIAAHARARVVSLLVRTPFYYWNRPEHATTSGTFHDDLDEYLDAVARVFRWIDDELDQPRFVQLLPRFRAYQLHMRVLPLVRWEHRTPQQRARIREFMSGILPTIPEGADGHLDPWRRIKAALLRAGRYDLVDAHERTFPMPQCVPQARGLGWSADGLRLEVALRWRFTAEDGPPVRYADGQAVLALAPGVAEFAREHGLSADVTDRLRGVTYAVDRRSRMQKIDWLLASGAGAELVDVDGAAELRARADIAWDPVDDGPDRLHDGPWDLYVRSTAMRTRTVRQVRMPSASRSWAIVHGVVMCAYRTQSGCVGVDVGQTLHSVVDDVRTTASRDGAEGGARVTIALPHVAVMGDARIDGHLVGEDGRLLGACRLVADGGTAVVEGGVSADVGAFAVRLGGGVRSRLRFRVRRRTVRVVPPAEHASRLGARGLLARVWRAVPASWRRRAWVWRHRRR